MHLAPAWVCVAVAALCAGTATILQAVAVRRAPTRSRVEVGLLWRLLGDPTYLVALTLVGTGSVLSMLALRTLPLFVVQAGRASSLGVAAVLAMLVLRARLTWSDAVSLLAVAAGLVVLAASVEPRPADAVSTGTHVLLAVVVLVVVGATVLALRSRERPRAGLVLGALAGVAYCVVAVCARTLGPLRADSLVADPGLYLMGVGGVLGLLLGALALQRAPAVATTALMVGVETCLGAVLGMALAGDRPAPGQWTLALVAFSLVVGGTAGIARFASPDGIVLQDAPDVGEWAERAPGQSAQAEDAPGVSPEPGGTALPEEQAPRR